MAVVRTSCICNGVVQLDYNSSPIAIVGMLQDQNFFDHYCTKISPSQPLFMKEVKMNVCQ